METDTEVVVEDVSMVSTASGLVVIVTRRRGQLELLITILFIPVFQATHR